MGAPSTQATRPDSRRTWHSSQLANLAPALSLESLSVMVLQSIKIDVKGDSCLTEGGKLCGCMK